MGYPSQRDYYRSGLHQEAVDKMSTKERKKEKNKQKRKELKERKKKMKIIITSKLSKEELKYIQFK